MRQTVLTAHIRKTVLTSALSKGECESLSRVAHSLCLGAQLSSGSDLDNSESIFIRGLNFDTTFVQSKSPDWSLHTLAGSFESHYETVQRWVSGIRYPI